jgi:predicted XRE-type DNA-binding protein
MSDTIIEIQPRTPVQQAVDYFRTGTTQDPITQAQAAAKFGVTQGAISRALHPLSRAIVFNPDRHLVQKDGNASRAVAWICNAPEGEKRTQAMAAKRFNITQSAVSRAMGILVAPNAKPDGRRGK